MTVELTLLSRVCYGSLEISGSRLQGLFALLAEDPHVGSSASRLVDALWPDEQPEHPLKALQVLVARARARFGPNAIVSTPGGYRLSLREDQIDAAAVALRASESEKWSRAGDHRAALGHADAKLHGTALEYLDNVLPSTIKAALFAVLPSQPNLPSRRVERELIDELRRTLG